MKRLISILQNYPVHLLLLLIFFCLHGSLENYGAVSFADAIKVGLAMFTATLLLFFSLWFILQKRQLAGLVALFIACWFFFFGALHDAIKSLPGLQLLSSFAVLVPLLVVASCIWAGYLFKHQKYWQPLNFYINMLLLIYTVVDAGQLLYLSAQSKKTVAKSLAFNKAMVTNSPNVYFLLFDAYPGQQSLSDSFQFNNDKFTGLLKEEGFVQLPVQSNYDITKYCMSSILNCSYVEDIYVVRKETQRDDQERLLEIKNAAIFSIFTQMGYSIKNNSIFDIGETEALSRYSGLVLKSTVLLADKILINRLMRNTALRFPDVVVRAIPFLQKQSIYQQRIENNNAIQELLNDVRKPSSSPVFSYTHVLMPHMPFYYDSLGLTVPEQNITSGQSYEAKQAFISYLQYTNRQASTLLLTIKQQDPKAIIIFMSDHGIPFNVQGYNPSNFDNVCFVHFPNSYYGSIPKQMSNINVFRYVLNTQFGQRYSLLKDTSFTRP